MLKEYLHKIEFTDTELLKDKIDKLYDNEVYCGFLSSDDKKIILTQNDADYITFKNMDNIPVKIYNDELFDGYMKMLVKQYDDHIDLIFLSFYCLKYEDNFYDFF